MSRIVDLFNQSADNLREDYLEKRNVLSFSEYMGDMASRPRTLLRDAARYLLDAIEYFGSYPVQYPWGQETRYKIYDQEFASSQEKLVGQEMAQQAILSGIASQAREGKGNRLLIIHGPNGSAKSTLIKCLFQGLEHYSRQPEGEQYRFRWIFPSKRTSHGNIGFGSKSDGTVIDSYAHLEDEHIDATLECEMRDHPLLIIPKDERQELMGHALEDAGIKDYRVPEYLLHSSLCHRCRQVADALMRTYQGDIRKVLAHVQIERWALSRRYRRGLVQVGPQMSADASQRQITADRSLGALPIELQNMTLFETFGSLVDGSGGIVEFEDMLKRPLDAFKYLLGTIETGEVMLGQAILKLNTILMGTTNDTMLEAFREHHDYPSFRDRMSLVSVPYIRNYNTESQIYELQIAPRMEKHVAPHAIKAAAEWAVLTRLRKPNPEAFSKNLRTTISKLTAADKCDLYNDGTTPEELPEDKAQELREAIVDLKNERATTWAYEGRHGASPRLIRQTLLRAGQSLQFDCLSPFAVVQELESVCSKSHEHPFLEREAEAGGYHDHLAFVGLVEERVLDWVEDDVRAASGLVEESKYGELLDKYVTHVSHKVKGEKVLDDTTGEYIDPDESMMTEVEKKIDIEGKPDEFRGSIISKIAAWAIENPKQKLDVPTVFPDYLRKIKKAYFEEHRSKVAKIARVSLAILSKEIEAFSEEDLEAGKDLIKVLLKNAAYCRACAKDSLARLVTKRFDHI